MGQQEVAVYGTLQDINGLADVVIGSCRASISKILDYLP